MESQNVSLDSTSASYKMALTDETGKTNTNINGDDTLTSSMDDADKINDSEKTKGSDKIDIYNNLSNISGADESIQEKQSVLCSDNNINDNSIIKCNESSASDNVCVNNSLTNVFNELKNTEKQSSECLNDSKTVSSVTKDKGGLPENCSNEKVQNEDEKTVLNEVEGGTLQEDNTNVNKIDEHELRKDTNPDVESSTSLKEIPSQQNVTSLPEKDDNVNIDNNSCVSEELSVSENNGNITNEKDNTVHEEDSRKDICDNSNASTAASRDHDDSNPPFGTDETSMNLSETGAGSGSEYERTERTRFLQCDDMITEGDDVMDVIEVNAVDPFAQTIDSERNDDTSMDVDEGTNDVNNQEASDDMDITHGMVQEMDVTKITDKIINETDKTEVNKDEAMDIEKETDKNADSSKISEQDMDVTKVNEKETNETEKNEDDKVPSNENDKGTEESQKDLNRTEVAESDMELTEINNTITNDSDKSDSKAEGSAEKDSKEKTDDKKTDSDEKSESAKITIDEKGDSESKDKENKEVSGSDDTEKTESGSDVTENKESGSDVTENKDSGSDVTENKESGSDVTENKESDTSTSEAKSKDEDTSKPATLKTATVVENDDEDVCIIPDTVPRVSNDPVVISKITDKLRTILTKSKTNIIQGQTESTASPSSRPQRQAAKRADAQIKATVHQLEDEDGEKENDEEDVDDPEELVETKSPTVTAPQQQQQQSPNQQICQQCCKMKICRFKILSQGKVLSYLCSEACSTKYRENLNEHIVAARAKKNETQKLDANSDKETKSTVDNESSVESTIKEANGPSISAVDGKANESASKQIVVRADAAPIKRPVIRRLNDDGEFIRACSECGNVIHPDERTLSWETMDFCNEVCLGKYQTSLGSHCSYCKKAVQQVSLGKYCVRFGYDIRQFCCASCLEEFKKGLKVCSYCQKDISSSVEGFLAPVGDKGQFKDFCTQSCMEKYDQMSTNQRPPPQMYPCDVCKNNKLVQVEVLMDSRISKLCSEVCFAAFKFVNTIKVDQCDMCRKYFDRANSATENLTVYYDDAQHNFCSKTCMNVYILAKRKIVPCNWCKVKKYNFDMIKRITADAQGVKQPLMMCSLNCLTLYQVSVNAVSSRRIKCDSCTSVAQAQYHLTMSDATIRNFCNYNCVMKFQAQYNKSPITLPGNQNTSSNAPVPTGVPVISSVKSLATPNSSHVLATSDSSSTVKQLNSVPSVQISNASTGAIVSGPVPVSLQTAGSIVTPNVAPILPASPTTNSTSPFHVIVKPTQPTKMVNKQTHCRPYMHTKGVSCRPHACVKQSQTENFEDDGRKILIPIPVPIYVPTPMHMFSCPTPVPFPIPLPVPVPIFIPTTRRSAKGIMQEIKKIQEKMPTDPFEAELLMMAEMVAEQKKQEDMSESEDDSRDADSGPAASANEADDTTPAARSVSEPTAEGGTSFNSGEIEANSNTFGADDMLQMALKMATELDDQSNSSAPVDLEAELTPNTITPAPPREMSSSASSRSNHTDGDENEEDVDDPEPVVRESRGRKRVGRPPGSTNRRNSSGSTPPVKRPRKSKSVNRNVTPVEPTPLPPPAPVPVEKPDANMCLKYTIGVNAWKQWVTAKNNELEKQLTASELEKLLSTSGNNKKVKLFKTELLQLTADELNYSLCLFVKEARKPNGTTYAPDTIYYFCLGIQQYLFENGRIDNIFTDPYYEKFTECLDEVAKVFSEVTDDTKLIVTRVEEEHLWESKQLGAHSPHVLLSTLMFFNTKNFNLTSVDEHMQLSFSHIMKHWKKNPGVPGSTPGKPAPGSRNVLLRFYPPQSALDANSKKKKVYEQQENEENPLRCPVKLYEFYLSKCPESVKTRNDVFYLLPERSCVPDSPVWYSTMALGKEPLLKMLHRVKMIKEINIALRSS